MAGNYPDVPGPRLAYDRDGSIGFYNDGGVISLMSPSDLATINDESTSQIGDNTTRVYGLIFPELRDLKGYYFSSSSGGDEPIRAVETSVNTTNGIDGTWVSRIGGSAVQSYGPVVPDYRIITSVTWDGIKGIRWTAGRAQRAAHFFGNITAGETPDRLRLWHPTLNQALDDSAVSPDGAYFDWGNVPQGTTQDRTFRVKNNSSTKTASTITVSLESLTPAGTPDVHTLSDGGSFGSTVSIASLAPGAISGVLTLRRTTPTGATLGVWVSRIIAAATTWT